LGAVAEVRYVALKALPVEVDGERQVLSPGEEIPVELVGSWVGHAIEAGKVGTLTELSLADVTDAAMKAEMTTRGYKVTKATVKA
jgi:hypothetical protein